MIFAYEEINKMPVVIIDEFYDEIASKKIMEELCFLNNDPRKLKPPEETGSAWIPDNSYKDGRRYLKSNKAVGLDSIYLDRTVSNILTENRKLFTNEVTGALVRLHPIFNYFNVINVDHTLVSYYEQSDNYESHHDHALLTAITWFYKTPKSFTGGNLILEDELKVDCISNRCVIFPSCMLHAVETINMKSDITENSSGRFAISQFLNITG